MGESRSIKRAVPIVCFTLLVLILSCTSAGALTNHVLHEDVTYWTLEGVQAVKVQQTVYDEDYTIYLKAREFIPSGVTGYLYAYSVTNLNVLEGYAGIRSFEVNWGLMPIYTGRSEQTLIEWYPEFSYIGPKWRWGGIGSLLPGETVGGLWAFAPTANDTVKSATIRAGADNSIVITGSTTGPVVPEPSGLAALVTGLVGILGVRSRRRLNR